jgi:NAD(P)H-hydrate epimerase
VVLLGRMDEVKGEAAAALRRLRDETRAVVVREVVDEAVLTACGDVLGDAELLIDAVVGTGFKPPLRGLAQALLGLVEGVGAPVVAVDVPSGWDADSMEQMVDGAFRADAVVTFTAPKMAHVFGHLTRETFGPVVVAGIGSPVVAIASSSGLSWAGASKAVAEIPRGVNSNKGTFGHVLVVGGGWGKAGAPAMASLAALRTGAGLVTAAVPERVDGGSAA